MVLCYQQSRLFNFENTFVHPGDQLIFGFLSIICGVYIGNDLNSWRIT